MNLQMNEIIIRKILTKKRDSNNEIKLNVSGVSMKPVFYEHDVITITPQEEYEIGDILVFTYNSGTVLTHRLLDIQGDTYICKGDNAFRVELITKDQIIGNVSTLERNGAVIPFRYFGKHSVALSMAVHREFLRQQRDMKKTKLTDIYKLGKKIEKEEPIVFQKSSSCNTAKGGEEQFIIDSLNEPLDIQSICEKLYNIRSISQEDAEDLLVYMIEQKLIELHVPIKQENATNLETKSL